MTIRKRSPSAMHPIIAHTIPPPPCLTVLCSEFISMQEIQEESLRRQTVKNRLNQRAFRARKQQYVRNLEEQVRQFQKEGIEATKEVQVAARSVAVENTLLRKLLKAHIHCNNDSEIDRLLLHMRGENSLPQNDDQIQSSSARGSQAVLPSRGRPQSIVPDMISPGPAQNLSSPTSMVQNSTSVEITRSQPIATTGSTSDTKDYAEENDSALLILSGNIGSDKSRPLDAELSARVTTSSAATQGSLSCEEAANIIAGLRLQNSDSIREELGCASQASCNIKSTTILQLMSDSF